MYAFAKQAALIARLALRNQHPCLLSLLAILLQTLVNHVLKNKQDLKIAVVENEFGEVGIDEGLVLESKEEILEMNNGCVCCTGEYSFNCHAESSIVMRFCSRSSELGRSTGCEHAGCAYDVRWHNYAGAGVFASCLPAGSVCPGYLLGSPFPCELDACALDAVLTVVDARHVTQHLDEIKPAGVVNEAGPFLHAPFLLLLLTETMCNNILALKPAGCLREPGSQRASCKSNFAARPMGRGALQANNPSVPELVFADPRSGKTAAHVQYHFCQCSVLMYSNTRSYTQHEAWRRGRGMEAR
eukprot:1156610-Pelagomonas_calceolata.AAC.8